ncbi:UDP-2,3-diacylglucosamine diphosphatase [Thiolapillus brandeum]|uniref:UDP-2,3-diacylglucosamine hydrolase n=1 Tax=Thiolapillus brandeum TaxID=1076588 RepID=A0A7U6JHF6_9GAMM|nr:UDP-2,3-diacylglucosamine diphosphatase [Thiolapillus brandeum]BAO44256.1 UDP-23-diacylglucosamine hydrolase [Thiolapillus brandeum]
MPPVLFISDLHLSPKTPELIQQFRRFLQGPVRTAHSLYILGDLFDAWIGDDDPSPFATEIQQLLADTTAHVPVYFQHGNRDFLLGDAFARETGVQLLPGEHVLETPFAPWLLLHGDQLCTDDSEYQKARKIFRSEAFKAQAMAMSIPQRMEKAAEIRRMSGEATAAKAENIMDVNQAAVEATMRRHGVRHMIHGHTHRPAVHEFSLDGQPARRAVLADWQDQGSFALALDRNSGKPVSIRV